MDQLLNNLVKYLSEVTGLGVTATPMPGDNLPYFFTRQYALYHLAIGGTSFTAAFLQEEADFKPVQFIKHMRQIPLVEPDGVCVVAHSLPTYVRKRLIEKGVSFIIPGIQMYLPALGMELRSRVARKKAQSVERFSPATQVVLIHWLLGRIEGAVTPLELSKRLWYSAMTMSRALDELEVSKVARVERAGRERLVSFPENRREAWEGVYPQMRNPVSKMVRIFEDKLPRENVVVAGTTALSSWSMLNEPAHPEYAISREAWKALEKSGVDLIPVEEPGTCLLQVWCYDPKMLEVDGRVDPFSLFLSLQDTDDERIEMALDEMMGQYL
ncbi:MAG: hypothetical protein QM500_11965 [Methylococcales bacterium]